MGIRRYHPFMELVTPSLSYKNSYLDAVQEYKADAFHARYTNMPEFSSDAEFEEFVKKIIGYSEGRALPEGYVSSTGLWLVDNGEFIGRVDIRHQLTEHLLKEGGHIGYDIRPSKRNQGYGSKILELAIPEAKELGITRILVTCDATNVASRKIIEKNGGVLENEVETEEGKPNKMRFWIGGVE